MGKNSPYDPEARYSLKRGMAWVGYKVHLTETCEEDMPRVITHVETTPATAPDDNRLEIIHAALAEKELLPQEHLVDCGYTDAQLLVTSQEDYGVSVIGPVSPDPGWQARENTGFDLSAFLINWRTQTATCPQGNHSIRWKADRDRTGTEIFKVYFSNKDCRSCPVRSSCTRARNAPRTLSIRTERCHEILQKMRRHQTTEEFRKQYTKRAGVEATLSQGVRAFDLRRSRYMGLVKTGLQHVLTAVAINLVRVMSWLNDPHPARPRVPAFAALTAHV